MTMKNKRLLIIVLIVVIILLIPLLEMQFTEAVNWKVSDFVVAGVLVLGTGLLLEIVLRKVKKSKYLIAICIVLVLLLIWAELAVGIFGSPLAGS